MACCDAPCCAPPCCPVPLCGPPPVPICCMPCPPPLMLPTVPEPVKPLMMPVEKCENRMDEEEQFVYRIANFYNNYNIDWKLESIKPCGPPARDPREEMKVQIGVTVDGKKPLCPDACRKDNCCTDQGCPTGFKPCVMRMCPPKGGHPCGIWCAEIQECPPKPTKKPNVPRPSPKGDTICRIHPCSTKCSPLCFNR